MRLLLCPLPHPPWLLAHPLAADYPDAGYFNSNKPHPQGEVLLRGGSVFKNYFKRPDLDAESFTEDGWFKTGDIGQWNADGTLSLIDRIKNLIKLSSGEYIALESLESVYKGANGRCLTSGLFAWSSLTMACFPSPQQPLRLRQLGLQPPPRHRHNTRGQPPTLPEGPGQHLRRRFAPSRATDDRP